ncbi:MAG: mandelate racemase/muconate lactonizing enzyme family protein [Planctomycetaceae bacterium]
MKRIEAVETINLRFAYDDGFEYAGGKCTARVTTLVLVHTDSGHTGIGTVYSHPLLLRLIIEHQLQPLLIGEDPCDTESIWNKMYRITRWYGRKGVAMSAIGGVDTALWDVRGKASGTPVWKLLGGQRGCCPAYASALLWQDVDGLAQEAASLRERGFQRVKMRLGRNWDFDCAAVQAVRAAIGADGDLLVDGSMRYDVPTARRLAQVLEEQGVFWFEEPFEPEDIDAFVELRNSVRVPLAAGENEFGLQGFRELIRAGAVDIVQPDASRCGGISEVQRVAQAAAAEGLRVGTHSWSDAVAIVANAHVVAASPNGLTVEVDRTGNPFVDDLLIEPLEICDGQLQLSERPGLGVELNAETLEQYRWTASDDIPDGAYSDMVFGAEHYNPAGPYTKSANSCGP